MEGKATGDLVAAAATGDQAAWDALVERYSGLLWSVARSYRLGEADAADVMQTTWLRLLEHLGRITDPERLAGWLSTVARNEIRRMHRRGVRVSLIGEDSALDAVGRTAPGSDRAALVADRNRQLWEAFTELSERCQELLRTVVIGTSGDDPLPYRDASQVLGIPVGGIGPTRMRCLALLRQALQRRGVEGGPEEN